MSWGRTSLLPLLLLPLPACGHVPAVRAPTPNERALIVVTVRSTWWYESAPDAAGYPLRWRRRHLERPSLRPEVTRIRVSRRDPRYASALVELRDRRGRPRGPRTVLVLKKSSASGRGQWGYPV